MENNQMLSTEQKKKSNIIYAQSGISYSSENAKKLQLRVIILMDLKKKKACRLKEARHKRMYCTVRLQ